MTRPIVFTGPSLSHEDAARILAADYRPPIRRGDLEQVRPNCVVGIIDGVFDQQLSISPSEITSALERGVRVFGSSSMGALRAAEIPGVVGVGRVYELYRRGKIDSDDEVAITFDPESLRALSVPLVNVRYAVERLVGPGTISRDTGGALLRAARRLPYWERSYAQIVRAAGLGTRTDAKQLVNMLAAFDLKRDDAMTLLEKIREVAPRRSARSRVAVEAARESSIARRVEGESLHLWELGAPLPYRELVVFLACTGALEAVARAARLDGFAACDVSPGPSADMLLARMLARISRAWSWTTEEEVEVSLQDLDIRHDALDASLSREIAIEQAAMAAVRSRDPAVLDALRVHLFVDDLALKREGARALSLEWLAARGTSATPAGVDERKAAVQKVCQLLDVADERSAREYVGWWGIESEEFDAFLARLVAARRVASLPLPLAVRARKIPLLDRRSPKARGSKRFCLPLTRALSISKRLASTIGVTRIAMITRLGNLGVPNAQAFRPDGEWSSTVGSGKSETVPGARVGAVMEEVEKWAQEQYARRGGESQTTATYAALARRTRDVIDPATLDLPYDSCYRPDLEIEWSRCPDLMSGRTLWVPAAALTHRRIANDLYFSPHGARKTVTTNGLASGFTIAEALTHAICEVIERHARTCAAIRGGNPGAPGEPPPTRIDLASLPRSVRRLVRKIQAAGHRVRVSDLTSEIRVPTFAATLLLEQPFAQATLFGDGWRRASGWACHPDPETAITMSILEACQTVMTLIAGAREDLTLAARSLGRHERTDAARRAAYMAELDEDVASRSFATCAGFTSSDAAADVRWILDRLRDAGCAYALVADYSLPEIAPARVVRAIIPGLDTINPFYTGMQPRLALVRDLIGPVQYGNSIRG